MEPSNISAEQFRGVRRALNSIFQRYVDIRRGNRQAEKHCYKKTDTILLTFDDYGSAEQLQHILTTLKRYQVRAMFFLQGDWVVEHPDLFDKIREAGHIVGNHTFSHANLGTLTADEVKHEIGRQPVAQPWFRPPYGSYNRKVRKILSDHGYVVCYWTVDSHDWSGHATEESILNRVLPRLHRGAVVLLHAHIQATVNVLPLLIEQIQQRGYRLDGFSDPLWLPRGIKSPANTPLANTK